MLQKFSDVFEAKLGTIRGFTSSMWLKSGVAPKCCKPRPVPFAIKQRIGDELDKLEKDGNLVRVMHSDWATPIVPVHKEDGTYRICGDYKVTINPCLEVDQYSLPKPEDIFATLAGGKTFSKIDLSQAYQQLTLDELSQALLTMTTHQGLYRCTRLPFGVASAPAIFQRVMDLMLQGIPNVVCYIDDILVMGPTDEAHLDNLETVLSRLQNHRVKAKRIKCVFMAKRCLTWGT